MPSQLLAGPAANFSFWTDEVAHCLALIDSYEERFQRMLSAQHIAAQNESHAQSWPTSPFIPPRNVPRPGRISEQMRRYVRSELCRAFHDFALACYHKTHLGGEVVLNACERLSICVSETEVPRSE